MGGVEVVVGCVVAAAHVVLVLVPYTAHSMRETSAKSISTKYFLSGTSFIASEIFGSRSG